MRDAVGLGEDIRSGATTCERVMRDCLDAIEKRNGELNAIVTLRPADELLAQAREADRVPAKGSLHGLPVAVKDLVRTKGLRTTFGSPSFADFVPDADDAIVRRMKAAGAIVIGKTNTPEWGFGSHTVNAVFGATRNPFSASRSAGGSSGGAGCALATGMTALADGSDMMGSLRNPAAWNGVYGLRPTWGLVQGDPPTGAAFADTFGDQLSTEGPMGRSPRDLAMLLDVMSEPDRRMPFAPRAATTFTRDLGAKRGARIGWWADQGGHLAVEPEVLEVCEAGLTAMDAKVVPFAVDFDLEAVWRAWLVLRQSASVERLGVLYANERHRARMKADAVWEIEEGLAVTAAQLREASAVRSRFHAVLVDSMEGLDAVALPAAQCLPFPSDWTWPRAIAGRTMDTYHRWMECVVTPSLLGLPAVAFATGFTAGLPAGVQLFARKGQDAALLGIAQAWHEDQA